MRAPLDDTARECAVMLQQMMSMQPVQPQILTLLPSEWPTSIPSAVGDVPAGSTLAHQQPIPSVSDSIIIHADAPDRQPCPRPVLVQQYDISTLSADLLSKYQDVSCSLGESDDFELATRLQSECPEWKNLRAVRVTASKFKNVASRKKDFRSLAQRLITGKTIQTSAMARGLELEPVAAECYARYKSVNVYCIGFIVNPSAPHLGCSPDRLVFDPSKQGQRWGLLEVKCPDKNSYKECQCLKQNSTGGEYHLKRTHDFYFQVQGQLGVTGFKWCDFMVYCKEDFIIDRIAFDEDFFVNMKLKLDTFYFDHFLPCLK